MLQYHFPAYCVYKKAFFFIHPNNFVTLLYIILELFTLFLFSCSTFSHSFIYFFYCFFALAPVRLFFCLTLDRSLTYRGIISLGFSFPYFFYTLQAIERVGKCDPWEHEEESLKLHDTDFRLIRAGVMWPWGTTWTFDDYKFAVLTFSRVEFLFNYFISIKNSFILLAFKVIGSDYS